MNDANESTVALNDDCFFKPFLCEDWMRGTIREISNERARVDDGDPTIDDPRSNGARMMTWVPSERLVLVGASAAKEKPSEEEEDA
jgi:hypothetical protein